MPVEGRASHSLFVLSMLLSLSLAGSLAAFPPKPVQGSPMLIDHDPIAIQGNTAFTPANGVVAGNGTAADPFEIWGWTINAGSGDAIDIEGTTAYVTIRNVEAWGSVRLASVQHAHLENVTLWQGSVILAGSDEVVVRGNAVMNGSISATPPAISAYPAPQGSQGIVIDGNTLRAQGWGGITVGVDNVTVSRNTVMYAHFGILVQADNASITSNDVSMVSGAIEIDHARNVTLRGNRVHAFQSGIFAVFPDNLTMVDNILSCGDHWLGCPNARSFYSINSTHLLAYHNRFLTVQETARDQDGVLDRWDDGYPSGGNYWVNYTGRDSCRGVNQTDCSLGDGLGDTPYRIEGGGAVDRYPLQLEPVSDTPTIDSTPPSSLNQGQPYTFEARVSDSGGIHNVTLYYGTPFGDEDHVVAMISGPDGAYRATITVPSDASWLGYYIQATDEVGNTATFPAPTFGDQEQVVMVTNPYAWLGAAAFLITSAAFATALILILRRRRPSRPMTVPPPGDLTHPGPPTR